jgi:hypothetical protein
MGARDAHKMLNGLQAMRLPGQWDNLPSLLQSPYFDYTGTLGHCAPIVGNEQSKTSAELPA